MAWSFMLPRASQRPREYRPALLVIAVHALVLAVLPSWTARGVMPESPRESLPPARAERIHFSPTPEPATSREEPRNQPALPPNLSANVEFRAADTLARITPIPPEARDSSARPPGLLDEPFAPPLRDPRLLAPLGNTLHSRSEGLAALRDSLEALRFAARQASGWILHVGGASYGVSPGALRFGRVVVPLPMFISLRDVNPLKRAERFMLQDVAEHAERRWRDSMLSARRTP